MFTSAIRQENCLLAALPADLFAHLLPHLEYVSLEVGQVIYEAGAIACWSYFPTDSLIALCCELASGATAEIAVVGNDGVVGFASLMGGESALHRAVVLGRGFAYRVRTLRLKDEFNRHGPLMSLILRYMQVLLTQIAQTAMCNRHHTVDQQLCRWLLMSLDRLPSNEIRITQALISDMLGVRREGVTDAALKLQKKGIIEYRRGQITVLDRAELEHKCCECYAVVRKEANRLLPCVHTPAASTTLKGSEAAARIALA